MRTQLLEYETYYNILQQSFLDIDPDLYFWFIPILGLSIAIVAKYLDVGVLSTLLFFIFATAMGWFAAYISKENYIEVRGLRTMLEKGLADVAEGKIMKFNPHPQSRRGYESFEVEGIIFRYTDGREDKGFARSRFHGGNILTEGMYVRIHYFHDHILKIEIAKPP